MPAVLRPATGKDRGAGRKMWCLPFAAFALILSWAVPDLARRAPPLKAGDIPLFQIRARVTKAGGRTPAAQTFTFRLNAGRQTVKSEGTDWSSWLEFNSGDAAEALRLYGNRRRQRYPVALSLLVARVVDPTQISAQIRFRERGPEIKLHADLFGPNLGIMLWRDKNGAPRAATMAGYNKRYWGAFDAAAVPNRQRPRHFIIVDRFIGGDNDLLDWKDGISNLAKTGITATIVPPVAPLRDIVLKSGLKGIALGAGISGGPLGVGRKAEPLDVWASSFAARYEKAGFRPGDFLLFALADEPGWYFPSALQAVDGNPDLLQAFHRYLAAQHLTPAMLGAGSWNQVRPAGHSTVSPGASLASRRLFYWSCRFFPWYAAEHMRQGTDQLHRAFTQNLKTFSNWNDFGGQFYFQGFPGHNGDPRSPDAAMGAPDWFTSGRMHATDLLWTEDWFGNNRAYQWSYYAAKLHSIAGRNGLEFGGYVIPQVEGEPADGLVQRILTMVGSGAKAVYYYNFGPNYNFPGNCYSDVPGVPPRLARADRMIGSAENVLWPGHRPQAQVGILEPRSAEVWDGLHIAPNSRITGVTGTNLNANNLDYISEEFDEYLALEMSDIPVDFVSEDELADGSLRKYKVLYITEPDVPAAGQRAIAQWVKNGGTLAMVPGAAQGDRYDQPANILAHLAGSPRHQRSYIPNVLDLKTTAMIEKAPVVGGTPAPATAGKVVTAFDDRAPAILQDDLGRGYLIDYSFFPGMSYGHLILDSRLGLKQSPQAEVFRRLVTMPVQVAGVTAPVRVSTPYVETPMLVSSSGSAITLLNWRGHNLSSVHVKVGATYHFSKAVSVTHGRIPLHREDGLTTFSVPLGAADIIELMH